MRSFPNFRILPERKCMNNVKNEEQSDLSVLMCSLHTYCPNYNYSYMFRKEIISQLIHTLFTNVLNVMYRHSQKGNNAPNKILLACLWPSMHARSDWKIIMTVNCITSWGFPPKSTGQENRGYVEPYHTDFMNYFSGLPHFL